MSLAFMEDFLCQLLAPYREKFRLLYSVDKTERKKAKE